MSIDKSIWSEFIGTAGLLIVVVGSGIMGQNLSPDNAAITLLANSIATGAGLYALIQMFGPISGAHFNPLVTFAEWLTKKISTKMLIHYMVAQILGGILGVFIAHSMFGYIIFQLSSQDRSHFRFLISEVVASFGLILVISLTGRKNAEAKPLAVALYITSAYWCTSSTSFANPAVTIARSFTDTFSGIQWNSTPSFIAAQFAGAGLAYWLSIRLLR